MQLTVHSPAPPLGLQKESSSFWGQSVAAVRPPQTVPVGTQNPPKGAKMAWHGTCPHLYMLLCNWAQSKHGDPVQKWWGLYVCGSDSAILSHRHGVAGTLRPCAVLQVQ